MKILFIKLFLCGLMFCATTVFAQELKITGVVVDYENIGLPGVNVTLKGSTVGTITDIDGNFIIKVPSRKSVLTFSFIGYASQEIAVGDRTSLHIKMTEDSKMIDEVVVVGFGTQKKENLTGAVKSVDVKVLDSRPITSTVSGLQGAVAGLNITNDNGGAPGQKMSMNIRGAGSISAGSSSGPLVLIDGIEGDLSLVNPNDIENISVLKDAAAASIYGSRAPFGVILVTTKTGKKGLSVSYSGNVRMQNPLNTPHMVDSYTHALVSNEANRNAGGGDLFGQGMLDKILAYQQGREMYDSKGEKMNIGWGTGPRTEDKVDWEWESGTWANTNWYDVYLKNLSYSQEHNISLDGGSEKITYFVSGRYYQQNGLYNFMKDNYATLTLNGNFNFKINDVVSFSWATRLVNETTDKPSAMNDLFFRNLSKLFPTTPLTMPNGDYNAYSFVPALRDGGQQVTKNQVLYNQLKLTVEPVKNWKIYVDFANRSEVPTYTRQFKQLTEVLPNGNLGFIPVLKGLSSGKYEINKDNSGFTVEPNSGDRWYEKHHGKVAYYNANARTDYEKTFGKHYFKVLVGAQLEYYSTEKTQVGTTGIISDDTPFLSVDSKNKVLRLENRGEWTTLGFFSRINYSWNDRYLLEANFRADGASRFPSNKRWGYFPSFSVGWNIAQEDFFEKLRDKGFDMFKLRGSYGSLGNQNVGMYQYFQHIKTSTPAYTFDGGETNGLLAPDPFSTNITWETIETIDLGLDLAFLSNRLNTSFDWYQRTTKDMVGPAQSLPAVFGATPPDENNAELRSRGWEFEIVWRDRVGKDWNYEIGASLSDYQDVVTKYNSPDNALKGYYKGKRLGDIYGYRVHGIAKNDDEMNAWLVNHDQTNISKVWGGGDFMYEDLNGDKGITDGAKTLDDPGDMTVIGNTTPRFQYSFRGSLRWKFLDFSMFWQGIGKRDLYFESSTFDGMGDAYDRPIAEEHMDYFRYADSLFGENLDAYYARPRTDAANNKPNDYYLQSGAYLRLKNVTVGYTLPSNTRLNKLVKTLRVYVSGENLFTFTPLRVFDPEAIGLSTATWGLGLTYPMFRTFSVGLSVTL